MMKKAKNTSIQKDKWRLIICCEIKDDAKMTFAYFQSINDIKVHEINQMSSNIR